MKNFWTRTAVFILLLWIVLAIVFGIQRGLFCFPALGSRCAEYNWDRFGDFILLRWLYEWQVLVAGAIAIVAAVVGGKFIHDQMRQTEEHERQRLERRHAAVRAVMPLALSSLTDYAESMGDALRAVLKQASGEAIPRDAKIPELPRAPVEALADLKEMIEASDGTMRAPFVDIIREIQVQNTRLRGLPEDIRGSANVVVVNYIEELVIDAASIYARSSALFNYARGEVTQVPAVLTWDEMRTALRLMGFRQENYPRIFQTTDRRELQGNQP